MLVKGLQHQAIAAESHDDIGFGHWNIAVAGGQVFLSLECFLRVAGDKGKLVGGNRPEVFGTGRRRRLVHEPRGLCVWQSAGQKAARVATLLRAEFRE